MAGPLGVGQILIVVGIRVDRIHLRRFDLGYRLGGGVGQIGGRHAAQHDVRVGATEAEARNPDGPCSPSTRGTPSAR
jgi:hypothetical protein